MANRMISTTFWDDTWVQEELDHDEKLLYLYLLTSPLTNIAGIYEIGIRRMCFDTGLPKEKVEQSLIRFEEFRKVIFNDNWIVMINWPKHQNITPESNVRKGIDRVLEEIPNHIFQLVAVSDYQYEYLKDLARFTAFEQDPYKPLASPLQGTRNTELNLTKLNLTKPNLSEARKKSEAAADSPVDNFCRIYAESLGQAAGVLTPKQVRQINQIPQDQLGRLFEQIARSNWLMERSTVAFIASNWEKILSDQLRDFKQGKALGPESNDELQQLFGRR